MYSVRLKGFVEMRSWGEMRNSSNFLKHLSGKQDPCVRCCFTRAFLASADPARQTHDEQESGESPALCRLSCCTCASVSPCEELQSCITQFAGFIGICKSKVWANSKAHLCTLPQYQQKKQEFSFGCLLCVLLSACVLCLQSNLFWDRSCWASDY